MQGYFIFAFVIAIALFVAEFTREKGFKNLIIKRSCDKNMIFPGEEFKVITEIENKKWLPISFLNIEEEYLNGVERLDSSTQRNTGDFSYYVSSYSVLWYERVKRAHRVKINNRGVYFIRNMVVTVGDIFGFSSKTMSFMEMLEIVVYPRILDPKKLEFNNNSLQGEEIIKRWIYKDPLFIKGIREYTREDRMKDIHWNSSLKMNKLMVREYDYTSEREVVFIINVQQGRPYWQSIDKNAVERSINVVMSMASYTIAEGIPTGLYTNAQIISFYGESDMSIPPSLNNFKAMLELGARIDYVPKDEFYIYLQQKSKRFNLNALYVIVTAYMDDETITCLTELRKKGFLLKIIDTSLQGNIPPIHMIEKINYREG